MSDTNLAWDDLEWREIDPVPKAKRTLVLCLDGQPIDGREVDDDVWGYELDTVV